MNFRNLARLAAFLTFATALCADDISVFHFGQEIAALAPVQGKIHRVAIPGGDVKNATALGGMAKVEVTEGVALVGVTPYGVSGRLIHQDMGFIRQVEMGSHMAIVTAARGTAVYFPGVELLQGIRLSEGFPRGVMMHRDIAAVHWDESIVLYGFRKGNLLQMVFKDAGLRGIHLGENTVVTMWGPEQGTFLHSLTDQGFFTVRLSYQDPGHLTARSGKKEWLSIGGESNIGSPFTSLQTLNMRSAKQDPAAFQSEVVPYTSIELPQE